MIGNINTSIIASSGTTTLKNLDIALNGVNKVSYNGSTARSLNITAASIGAAASNHIHAATQLTNGTNLDIILTVGNYYAPGSNNCVNKPAGVDPFSLQVLRSADGYHSQILISSSKIDQPDRMYIRTHGPLPSDAPPTWSAWTYFYTTANKPSPADIGAASASHRHTSFADLPTGMETGYITTGNNNGGTTGFAATAEGNGASAAGRASHAEGNNCSSSGPSSHAEGSNSAATGYITHAEGNECTATGDFSHAEGYLCIASNQASHAEGGSCTAAGNYSHAGGWKSIASGTFAFAHGDHCEAYRTATAFGKCNIDRSSSMFVIGNGMPESAPAPEIRSNAFRVANSGDTFCTGAFNGSGADYGEYFEWLDGNPDKEDRVGLFVTMDEDRIAIANSSNDYIIGAISGHCSIIGNSQDDQWCDMYLKDAFGRLKTEHESVTTLSADKSKTDTVVEVRQIVNPEYDNTKEYIPRSERPEWDVVGMFGVLTVRDDGTCKVNSYCKVTTGGIVTATTEGYRVLKRISDNIIKVLYK